MKPGQSTAESATARAGGVSRDIVSSITADGLKIPSRFFVKGLDSAQQRSCYATPTTIHPEPRSHRYFDRRMALRRLGVAAPGGLSAGERHAPARNYHVSRR
jgi:hypothetical protein